MPLSVNIGGAYKQMNDGWVNIGGVWKKIDKISTNIGGVWKEGYSSIRLDPTNILFSQQWATTALYSTTYTSIDCVKIGKDGNIYVAYRRWQSGVYNLRYLKKINGSTGAIAWTITLPTTYANAANKTYGLDIDASGNIYELSKQMVSTTLYFTVKKYNSAGTEIGSYNILTTTSSPTGVIAVDSSLRVHFGTSAVRTHYIINSSLSGYTTDAFTTGYTGIGSIAVTSSEVIAGLFFADTSEGDIRYGKHLLAGGTDTYTVEINSNNGWSSNPSFKTLNNSNGSTQVTSDNLYFYALTRGQISSTGDNIWKLTKVQISDMSVVWTVTTDENDTEYYDFTNLSIDANDNVYITSYLNGGSTIKLHAYNGSGTKIGDYTLSGNYKASIYASPYIAGLINVDETNKIVSRFI